MMKCQDLENLLDDHADIDLTPTEEASVGNHLSSCEPCKSAWRSAQALRDWNETPAPRPRAGLFEETMRHTTAAATPRLPHRPFWLGTAVGGALAASIVLTILGLNPTVPGTTANPIPALTVALHETRHMSIAIESGTALADARIRVVLTGGIELDGFAGRSAVSWTTDLVPGVNRLTLPVTAAASDGGQVLVEVEHGSKRQIFLVQVAVDAAHRDLGAVFTSQGARPLAAKSQPDHGPDFVKFVKLRTRFDV